MTCSRSKELLSLYAGGDLTDLEAERVNRHVTNCQECQEFARNLERNQSLLRSLRPKVVASSTLAELRQGIMSQIGNGPEALGWRVRLERFLLVGFRKPLVAVAGIGIIAIVSVTLFAQIQHFEPRPGERVAVFEARETLIRPEGYREWIFVGSSVGPGHPGSVETGSLLFRNVYINPSAYHDYVRTGEFPEGTVMVLESAKAATKREQSAQGSYETEFVALKTSVKDSRFAGGWGYFDFTDSKGRLMAKAAPEDTGCLSCHQDEAETDHVFTQFYPVLRSVSGVL